MLRVIVGVVSVCFAQKCCKVLEVRDERVLLAYSIREKRIGSTANVGVYLFAAS